MTHIMMPTLYIQPERREDFTRLITAEVEHSLKVEPGILRFDLAWDKTDPNAIHVYAVYEDEAAYAFHQRQPYYVELMEKISPCFSKPPDIRMATNLLPRDAAWATLAASRKARIGRPRKAARKTPRKTTRRKRQR